MTYNREARIAIRMFLDRFNNAETEEELDKLVCDTTVETMRMTLKQLTLDEKIELVQMNINALQVMEGLRK